MGPAVVPHSSHTYRNKYLVDSVFPAPDSPDTIIDWDCFRTFMSRNDLSAAKAVICQYVSMFNANW